MRDASGIMVVLQTPKTGRESDHRDWYLQTHLPDVCAIPGVIHGAFVTADGAGSPPWSNAALYWLDRDPAEFVSDLFSKAGAGKMELSDTLDPDRTLITIATALTPRMCSTVTPGSPALERRFYVVFTNATLGDEDRFNAWYSDVHLSEVLQVPGFVAAQRFRLIDHPALEPCPQRYLAVYEIEATAVDESLAELTARAESGRMVISPSLDTSTIYAAAFHVPGARQNSG